MAVAHAKFTGELGVCLATGGPGATHLITGLYDAKLDHMPVLAICGQAESTVRGGSYQQELNLDRMFADVAEYVQEVDAARTAAARDRPGDPSCAREARAIGGHHPEGRAGASLRGAEARAWLHSLGSRLFAAR